MKVNRAIYDGLRLQILAESFIYSSRISRNFEYSDTFQRKIRISARNFVSTFYIIDIFM